jgi:hypothetical protein
MDTLLNSSSFPQLQEIEHLDKERKRRRLWPPVLPLRYILSWSAWEFNESTEKADDEDPGELRLVVTPVCSPDAVS